MYARCIFAERTAVDGGFRYDRISIANRDGDGYLRTPMPPVVGDLIHLRDISEDGPRGMFVVVARQWSYSSWGSTDWPYGEAESKQGPMLDIIVERAEGVYQDEVYDPDAE